MRLILISLGCVLMLIRCNSNELGGRDFMKYVEDEENGLNNIKAIEDLNYQLQYCPTEYLVINEYKTFDVSKKLMDIKIKENDSLMYFKLRISGKKELGEVLNYKAQSSNDYYSRIEYLSYGFEENIMFIAGPDTLAPAIYHFERTYGVVPHIDLLFAFVAGQKKHDDVSIIIDDKIFENGLLKFSYSKNTLNSIPKLKAD